MENISGTWRETETETAGQGGGRESTAEKDVFDTEHHVVPGCSLTLTSVMPEHVSEAGRAAAGKALQERRCACGKRGCLEEMHPLSHSC